MRELGKAVRMMSLRRARACATRVGRHRGARGFTVVEVLVALVVLMIGVYAMVRIFPKGYTAVEASQMRTTASQLAEAELAFWKLHPESLPDEIVATDYAGNVVDATQTGTATDANGAGTMASLLVTERQRIALLPGSSTYDLPTIAGEVFADINRVPGAVYNPADLTPSQVNAVTGFASSGSDKRELLANPNWQPNSMYLPRTIIGEQVDIRRLTTTATGIPFYLLSQAPLDVLRYEDNPRTPQVGHSVPVLVDVYDARPWQYVAPSVPVQSTQLGDREFTYDAAAQVLYFGPRRESVALDANKRLFKVDYAGQQRDGSLVRIFGKTIDVVNGVGLQPLKPPPVDVETLRVYEMLEQTSNPADLEDVGETARRNIYYIDNPTAPITGAIQFPLVLQVDPRPSDVALVKVDYRVLDWQILSFDVEVPPSGWVELPIKAIKGAAFIDLPRQPRPQPVAKGIRVLYKPDGTIEPRGANDAATWAFLVAVDRQNGDILTERLSTAYPTNPFMRRSSLVKVDYRNGRIQFNYYVAKRPGGRFLFDPNEVAENNYRSDIDTPDRSGRVYRIFCRSESDWAVQLMMAARVYGRSHTGLPGGSPIGASGGLGALLSYAWNPAVDAKQIYFPLSETEQAVAVDYYDATGVFHDGEIHTIGGAMLVAFPGQLAGSKVYVWVCPLVLPLTYSPGQFGPITVRGVSLRARAAWMGPGRRATLQDVAKVIDRAAGRSDNFRTPNKSLEETWHQVLVSSYVTRTPI